MNDQQVLAFLATAHKALSLREIAAAMGIRHSGRRALGKIIPRLARHGEIVEIRNGRYKLPGDSGPQQSKKEKNKSERPERAPRASSEAMRSTHAGEAVRPAQSSQAVRSAQSGHANLSNVIEGRLVAHRDGYGFVVPAKPIPGMEGDLFIGAGRMGCLLYTSRCV